MAHSIEHMQFADSLLTIDRKGKTGNAQKNRKMHLLLRLVSAAVLGGAILLNAWPVTANDYTLNDNGTLTDSQTGLRWMRCSVGQTWTGSTCTGTANEYSWNEALALRHSFAGYTDWRLPTKDELLSIVDSSRTNPSIDVIAFPNTPTISTSLYFWSSSPSDSDSSRAWVVYFGNGYPFEGFRNESLRTRLVRSGQSIDQNTTYNLTASYAGGGSGAITSTGLTNISWNGVTGTASYNAGTSITLTATAAAGSAFAGWSGACSGSDTCTLTMDGDQSVTATFSPIDYTLNDNGTLTDSQTGLRWMRCSVGQTWTGSTCTGTANEYSWNEALALRHSFAGYTDWRLPTKDELLSIVDKLQDINAFPNIPNTMSSYFWAVSTLGSCSPSSWWVRLSDGYATIYNITPHPHVLLVRGACGSVDSNLNLNLPSVNVDGIYYNVNLSHYTNPTDPWNLYWALGSTTDAQNSGEHCASVDSGLNVTISCIDVDGANYSATLFKYSNPSDLAGYYWKFGNISLSDATINGTWCGSATSSIFSGCTASLSGEITKIGNKLTGQGSLSGSCLRSTINGTLSGTVNDNGGLAFGFIGDNSGESVTFSGVVAQGIMSGSYNWPSENDSGNWTLMR